jgi:hypothetical protein
MNLPELYRERQAARSLEKERRRRRLTLVSVARLVVAACFVALLWFVWETDLVSSSWLAVPLAIFVVLLVVHNDLDREQRRTVRAEEFYRRGVERLEHTWPGRGRSGEAFLERDHPYGRDLDIFGKGSLFELLSTTVSPWGTRTLADWLKHGADLDVARARQESVRELRPLLELRERLASEPDEATDTVDAAHLEKWATSPLLLTSTLVRWVAFGIGLVVSTLAVLWLASFVSRAAFLAGLAVSGALGLVFRERVRAVLAAVERPSRELSVLATLLEILEREKFSSERLASLQKELVHDGEPASVQIRRLARLVEYLDARRNQLFMPVAALLLWGTQVAFALEAWRARNGTAVPRWLRSVSELDALLAIAGYAFENPDDPFPELSSERALFEARGLGHPLIPEDRLVRNDVSLGWPVRLFVVSGSNMSGKSTLLRAIGVNTVLALCGAPVRATKLTLSKLQVAASIRIEDSLQDGISHFYAEILRLRQVMELASMETTVLFLLDEILHGTNSHDRRIGAEAVVRGLVDRGAVGLITTHDLALAELAETMGEAAENVHFEDQIEGGKIRFDYRMREGVVKKSNALELMRSIGLEV